MRGLSNSQPTNARTDHDNVDVAQSPFTSIRYVTQWDST